MIKIISRTTYLEYSGKSFSINKDYPVNQEICNRGYSYLKVDTFNFKVKPNRSYIQGSTVMIPEKYYILEGVLNISSQDNEEARLGLNDHYTYNSEYFKFSGRLLRITAENQLVLDCSTDNHAIIITIDPQWIKISNVIEAEVELDKE